MTDRTNNVITRFAPSPTGHLHIGGARTALFCWAWARRTGGAFLLRIEDTDQARSSEASTQAIMRDLAWLGIEWDEGPGWEEAKKRRSDEATKGEQKMLGGDPRGVGPFSQSQRLESYNKSIDQLMEVGRAYAAFETTEELAIKRQSARDAKETYRYDRAALEIPDEERAARVAAGEAHVIRFKVDDSEVIVVPDEVLGDIRIAPGELEDFIIRKRDGFPTYHLAVVVDDELMGVTHVLRGQEHLSNIPKHVALQRGLGFRVPIYAHMPLIFNERGGKMSKRERDQAARQAAKDAGLGTSPTKAIGDEVLASWIKDKKMQLEHDQLEALAEHLHIHLPEVSVDDFRRAGYLPEVICNFIALLGWTPSKIEDGSEREVFDLAFLAQDFDLLRIGKSNAHFDRAKLAAFNADAIQNHMSDQEFARRWREWAEEFDPDLINRLGDRFDLFARAVRPRTRILSEARTPGAFALMADDAVVFDEKAVQKALLKGEPSGLAMLGTIRAVIEGIEPFEPEVIEGAIKGWCESNGVGMGKVAQPLRVALTGTSVSPGLGDTLALVGRESVLRRIDRCLKECSAHSD